MNVKLGRPKFVLRKLVIGLDQPTSNALSYLVRKVQAVGGQTETDAARYAIRAMAKSFQVSEAESQKGPGPNGN